MVVLSKSMSKYATENVLSQYVQWVGNNSSGATQSNLKPQHTIFWWLTALPSPTTRGCTKGGSGAGGGDKV